MQQGGAKQGWMAEERSGGFVCLPLLSKLSCVIKKSGKPEVVLHYNCTKGVENMCPDSIIANYTYHEAVRRWQTRMLSLMLSGANLYTDAVTEEVPLADM